MMRGDERILLLADEPAQAQLRRPLGEGCVALDEPYQALEALAGARFDAMVLTAPRPELGGFCRAARRLLPRGGLYAVCSPAAEAEVRGIGGLLTDYFIYPPSPQELSIVRAAAPPIAGPRSLASDLSPADTASLVAATGGVGELEAAVAALVARRLGVRVAWQPLAELDSAVRPLLTAGDEQPRALVADVPVETTMGAGLLSAMGVLLPPLMEAARRTENLHRLAITDHLTGAYNRRYFYHVTDQIIARCGSEARVTLLLYDIDSFKHYNDTYGYAAGDQILRETASLMKRITRSHDIVARIGGDEFAVLFWDAAPPRSPDSRPPDSAWVLADRFRQAVRTHEFPFLGAESRGTVSVSGGLANFPHDGRSCRELLRSADAALKASKRSGKNAIRLSAHG
jgi:diguanylate cyclase (GGDEF)-like protein